MTCPACDLADKGELTGLYHTGCESCTARHIANGIDLFNAIQAGGKTPSTTKPSGRFGGIVGRPGTSW